jgi:hypothetical protein
MIRQVILLMLVGLMFLQATLWRWLKIPAHTEILEAGPRQTRLWNCSVRYLVFVEVNRRTFLSKIEMSRILWNRLNTVSKPT